MMQLCVPHPLEPTKATVVPALILTFILFKIGTSGLAGYLKLTSLNSMSPINLAGFSPLSDEVSIAGVYNNYLR